MEGPGRLQHLFEHQLTITTSKLHQVCRAARTGINQSLVDTFGMTCISNSNQPMAEWFPTSPGP